MIDIELTQYADIIKQVITEYATTPLVQVCLLSQSTTEGGNHSHRWCSVMTCTSFMLWKLKGDLD